MSWGLRPSDFWGMHPTEFWWYAEIKRVKPTFGCMSEDEVAYLYEREYGRQD